MKRVLAVALCLLMLVSSLTTSLFSTASAAEYDTVFDNPENWTIYSAASGLGTTAAVASWASVTQNTNTAKTYGGDASSLRLNAYCQYTSIRFDVKPNTEYSFTYRMFYDGTNATEKILSHSGINSVGGTAEWGKDGCYDFYGTSGSARCDSGLWATNGDAISTTSTRGKVTQWQEGGKWHQVTHTFNSGNNEEMIFSLRFTAANNNNFYLDDFNLTAIIDFENIANWGIYHTDAKGDYVGYATIDGTAPAKRDWATITLNSAITASGSGNSVKLNGNTVSNAIMLNGLKANTKYNLTFKYYIPTGSAWGSSSKAWFTSGIVKSGVAMNGALPSAYHFKGTAPTTDAGSWYDYTLSFTTDSTTDYAFTVYATFASGFNIYLDEIALNEAPRPTYLIQDFEDYTKSNNEYYGGVSIVEPEGTKISGNKAVLYDGSAATNTAEAQNRIIINPVSSDLPTLGDLVNKGSNFKVTIKYKLLEGDVKFYLHSSKDGVSANNSHNELNPISYKSTTLSAGDTWQEFSHEFTLKAEAVDGTYNYPTLLIGGTGKAYFDYITVSTLTAEVPDVEIPDETPVVTDHEYFEDISNWKTVNGASSVSGSKNLPGYTNGNDLAASTAWYKVTSNTNTAYINSGEKSVRIDGNATYNYIMLPELKANNKYTLTFKYYADYINSNGNKVFAKLGIYNPVAEGATLSGTAGDVVMAPISATAKVWNDVTLDFTTDENTELALLTNIALGAKPTDVEGNQYVAFLDAFELVDNGSVDVPQTDPFEDISNWGVYHKDAKGDYLGYATVDGTAPAKRDWVNISIDTANTATGEGVSVKLNGNTTLNAVKIPTLKANTNYDLTFKYLIPKDATWGSSAKAWFTPGIIKKGIAMNGANPTEYFAKGTAPTTPTSPSDGSWKDYTLSFETDDSTDFFFGITATMSSSYIIYLDEIKVTEKIGGGTDPDPNPDPDPEPEVPAGPSNYDDAASWKLYHTNYAPIVNGNGPTEQGWIKNTNNTDKAYTYNEGANSIKINGNIQYTAIKLNDLVKGKAYKVSFKYFAPTTSTVGPSSQAWVNQVGIVKGGTAMNGNSPTEYLKKGAIFAGEAGKWQEYSMLFRAETTDLYFGMCLTFGAGFIIYLDDFTVTETNEDPDIAPVVPGYEPKEEVIIDFDNYGGNATVSPNDRIEIVEAKGFDGKNSKMLHFIKGQYSNATTLNYNSTYATDTDTVFTVGVKPKKVYNVSFRVKTNSQTLPAGAKSEWVGIYFTFGKQYLISSYQHTAKRDEWLYYEYTLSTTANQNLLSFYVNAGESTPDMWVDDITITETDYEPFLGWGTEPRDEILINFDDFYVGYDIACASIVDGPERDGKVTKATYLKGGSYDYNVVANYSAVTQYRDPIFTVPCKPNTLYEFSYYIYVPKDTGSLTYFAVYYDWANTWVLRASSMPERDEWVKKTIRFTTKAGQTQLSLTFNGGKVIPDIYLDDIRLKELKPGTVDYSDLTYCEDAFNNFETEGFMDQIISGKSNVIKIPVRKQTQHTLGITVSSSKISDSRVFLSFDGVNPIPTSEEGAPSAVFYADGTTKRYGIDFITDSTDYIYLVIENDDGAITISDPMLFTTKSISADILIGKATPVSKTGLSVNKGGSLIELVVFGSEDISDDNDSSDSNPSTGSQTILPVVILFFTLLITCALLAKFKKGGEQA